MCLGLTEKVITAERRISDTSSTRIYEKHLRRSCSCHVHSVDPSLEHGYDDLHQEQRSSVAEAPTFEQAEHRGPIE